MRSRIWLFLGMTAALAPGGLGCGRPSVSGSSQEATVSGVVRLHGKAVDNGVVTFNVANVDRPSAHPREAPIGVDGSYTATTLVGENNVEVTCRQLRTAKYARYAEDEHFLKVNPGANAFDIDIPPTPVR